MSAKNQGLNKDQNKQLNETHSVKAHLDEVRRIISEILLKARFYQALADGIYPDLGLIATAAMFEEEDFETVVRFESLPIGEFFLDVNSRGDVDTCFRERPFTVKQMVDKFGLSKVSPMIRRAFEKGNLGQTFVVIHAVLPNDDIQLHRADARGMAFSSFWWEQGDPSNNFLEERGYREFPVIAPRLSAIAGEVYGRGGPGWGSVGDCKALQHLEERLQELVDLTARPPMRASRAMKNERSSLLPGDITYVPDSQSQVFEPAMSIPPMAIEKTEANIQRHELRIEREFMVDLWMAMLSDRRQTPATATEVELRQQEVMLQLGPFLENLNNGLLDPVITRTYSIALRAGLLPDPPEELQGSEMQVQYISILHQAQKLTSLAGIRELIIEATGLASMGREDAIDKIDVDAVMDELADILGVRPDLVLSEDEVMEVRRTKAEQAQAQQQGQAMLAATEGAKNLSASDPEKIQDIARMVSPAAAAQGGVL
jgi:hypothetical protein